MINIFRKDLKNISLFLPRNKKISCINKASFLII